MNEKSQLSDIGKHDVVCYPLSHPQKRIWYIEKLYPNTPLYNIGGPSRVKGVVNFKLLEEAINIFIQRNDALRLHIIEQNGVVKQYISKYHQEKIAYFDFSTTANPEQEFNTWALAEITRLFQLVNSNLYYFALYKIDDHQTGFLAKFHHIIADGRSTNLTSEQIYDHYHKLLRGEEVVCEPEYSYLEYLEHEHQYLNSERFIKNRTFWMAKFKELPETVSINLSENTTGKRIRFELGNSLSPKIKEFTAHHQCSLNTFFISLFLIYLSKVTQQNDLVIGTPVLNRSGKEKRIFGMFTSTMPFRFLVDLQSTVVQMVEKVNEELVKFYFHQKYPYDLLVQDIELKKKGYDNLFQVCVNYYNTRLDIEVNDSFVETEELYNGNQFYALQLVIKDWASNGNLTLEFDYQLSNYTAAQINQLFRCLLNLAEQLLNDPSMTIIKLNVLSESEKNKQISEFNATESCYPLDHTIYQLFEAQVQKTPDNVAVCCENLQLTYSELNKKSNQLARMIRNKGVTRDSIVGLMVTHSIEAIIGILGIIKAGGAYLPIDPEYPAERIEYMLSDSGCRILLTNCLNKINITFQIEIMAIQNAELNSFEAANLELINRPEDLVYVIYTSGSTGKPKGVMIEHRGLVNYIWWAKQMYVRDESDSFAFYSSLSFDLTVTSVFTPLIGGNPIMVYRDDGTEYVLYKIIRENRVSIVKLTPSHLALLKEMDHRRSKVKRFIVGGEDLKTVLAASIYESFGGDIEIYNEYGPTETVVGCMIYKFDYHHDTRTSVPIGVPAHNVQIYILDQDLKPLPEGSIGEMYISGDGVARGYLNRPELTAERFIESPYRYGKKMYRTGDLARFLSNGEIEYAGRSDQQIKIRGYRIELGEIEKRLLNHNLIQDAVVIDREKVDGNKYLCAYLVVAANCPAGETWSAEIKDYLRKELPEYMVPPYLIIVPSIPLTPNGKVNRKELPEPQLIMADSPEFLAPVNNSEETLLKVVKATLKIPEIGMNSNFYQLGGDSIKAIQIAAQLNELGYQIKVRDILGHPLLAEMACCLADDCHQIDQGLVMGSFQPPPIYAWFLGQHFCNDHYYLQTVLLDWKVELTVAEFRQIMQELIKHHDALRLNYHRAAGELYYNDELLPTVNPVFDYDLSQQSLESQNEMIRSYRGELLSGFNIENGVLLKAALFNLGARGQKVLLVAHHLAVDGISWRILLEDIRRIYLQLKAGSGIILPLKTHAVKEWAARLLEYSRMMSNDEVEYWEPLWNRKFDFPVNFDRGPDRIADCRTIGFRLTKTETGQLIPKSNGALGAETLELLITTLVLTVHKFTGQAEVLLELEGHGREEISKDLNLTRTVGWFTSIYPVVFPILDFDLRAQLQVVREQLRRIPSHGIGFGVLKYLQERNTGPEPKRIRFNFLGEAGTGNADDCFTASFEDLATVSDPGNYLTALLEINALIIEGQLNCAITFSLNKFAPATIDNFRKRFKEQIQEIARFNTMTEQERQPTDFELVKLAPDDWESLIV